MIYLAENIASHRKILRAGQLIGDAKGGEMAALGLFVAAIGYARSHLTDGLVPDEYLLEVSRNRHAISALRHVKLIQKVRGHRWRINDFLDWNKSASEVAKERDLSKARQRRWRATHQGESGNSNGVTGALGGETITVPSRGIPYPQSPIPDPQPPIPNLGAPSPPGPSGESDVPIREQRPAGRETSTKLKLSSTRKHELGQIPAADDNFAVLVRLVHSVMDAEKNSDPTSPKLIEAAKRAAAERHIKYHPETFNRALRSAGTQRVRGYTSSGPLTSMADAVRTAIETNTLPETIRQMAMSGPRPRRLHRR